MLPTAVSVDSVHDLSKVLGNGRTVPKDALNVDWLGAADINAIHWQAHPTRIAVRQELTRATEKCCGTCQVRLWNPMSGAAFLDDVTRTLRKAGLSCNELGAEVGADLRHSH
jgi:hypothetical protein